jgi:hypothetical protein
MDPTYVLVNDEMRVVGTFDTMAEAFYKTKKIRESTPTKGSVYIVRTDFLEARMRRKLQSTVRKTETTL